ncbi:uncharacterized protein LOC125821728 [Solanum verrucosum]|uniref:uncharacterized protein LOC125821728 n=1 Tax=Solanum verrucosum TaxID=315347 RepID=UPI0020D12776|nr:uncharacterized protein LOC125821728 [Solanum verrucosum]
MRYINYNTNGQIWVFIKEGTSVGVISDTKQQLTLQLTLDNGYQFMVTMVYAKCTALERLCLWEDLYTIGLDFSLPWMVGGDFNVIMEEDEKISGLLVYPQEYEDFALSINSCELFDLHFIGNPFTWWKGKSDGECIFKRLDMVVINQALQDLFGHLEIQHLARTGSDHANLQWKLRLKKTKLALTRWSKAKYEDIFKQLLIREEIVKVKEHLFEEHLTSLNNRVLRQAQEEYNLYLYYEEEFWRQKASIQWYNEEDKNTKFFHRLVKGRRKRLALQRVLRSYGTWAEGEEEVLVEAVNFFQHQFIGVIVERILI